MSYTDSAFFAMFHAGIGIIPMLSSISSFKLDWHRRAHLQSLAMVCLGSSSALGKTTSAARAGFAQV